MHNGREVNSARFWHKHKQPVLFTSVMLERVRDTSGPEFKLDPADLWAEPILTNERREGVRFHRSSKKIVQRCKQHHDGLFVKTYRTAVGGIHPILAQPQLHSCCGWCNHDLGLAQFYLWQPKRGQPLRYGCLFSMPIPIGSPPNDTGGVPKCKNSTCYCVSRTVCPVEKGDDHK